MHMQRFYFDHSKHDKASSIDHYEVTPEKYRLTTEKMAFCDYFEIMHINSGQGTIVLDEMRVDYKEGDFIFCRPFQVRHFISDGYTADNIIFYDSLFDSYFHDTRFLSRIKFFKENSSPLLNPEIGELIFPSFRRLVEVLSTRKTVNIEHMARGLVYYILAEASGDEPIEVSEQRNDIVHFKELLENHYLQESEERFYAAKLRCGVNKLEKLCKQYYNKTFAQVYKERKLIEAKKELPQQKSTYPT